MPIKDIKGRCFCGAIEFAVTPPTNFLSNCHCQSCRLSHGAAFVTWTSVPKDRFRFLTGEKTISWYSSSEWIQWGFCLRCGSPLLYRVVKEGHPESPKKDQMYISAASLVDPLDRKLDGHVSFEEKVEWLPIEDDLAKYRGKGMERLDSQIDSSLTDYSLGLSYEERIEVNDSAIELTRELQKAGQEFYAREPKSSP